MFRQRYTLENRKRISDSLLSKYPNKIPVIIERCRNGPELDKFKILVPQDITIGEFLRKNKKFFTNHNDIDKTLFAIISVKNKYAYEIVPSTTDLFCVIYNKYKNEDGFLYIMLVYENCFGNKTELLDDECLICFTQSNNLMSVCTTFNCEGYTHGICSACYNVCIDRDNTIKCPICRTVSDIEPNTCCVIS